ncbi:MAG: YeeE/YedE family protein [Anaeromyxobacteraceae bacterium]
MTAFIPPLVGGVLIGAAATLLLLVNGRVAGVSGIAAGLLSPARGDWGWRAAFVGGLVAGGLLLRVFAPASFGAPVVSSAATAVASCLLVGFGTRLGGGCTSGHGVCGVSRGAPRSILATATFVLTGAVTVFVVRHVVGGG